MVRVQRIWLPVVLRLRPAVATACVIAGAGLAGCSADISRLDSPSYSLAEKAPRPSEPLGRRNAGAPNPNKNDGWPDSGPRSGALPPPLPAPPANTTVAALPQPIQQQSGAPVVGPSRPFDAPKKEVAARPLAAPGQTIDVAPGDTLYGLSKKYHVSVTDLMEVNGLKSAALKPGQKLAIPNSARRPLERAAAAPAAVPPASATKTAAVTPPAPSAIAPPPAAAAPPVDWNGTHTVKAGELLYGIARQYKIKTAELQSANAITEPTKVRPGSVLKVPGEAGAAPAVAAPAAPAAASPKPAPAAIAAPAAPPALPEPKTQISGGPGVKVINSVPAPAATAPAAPAPTKVASIGGAVPTGKASAVKFAWPAKGNLIGEFGKRADGSSNDGINIAVPAGTDVMAADTGMIAYAGSELKGYGNLVLVRHENGWVSAYAHADEVLVKRGDTVKRGQAIAKAGKTGSVDQPQVHFELRQGSSPVDPLPHMEKN